MRIIRSVDEFQSWRSSLGHGQRVAFVPTMGFLHEGHLSLMREGRRRVPSSEGVLVVSIFVNPTQFNDPTDLESYPRDETGDLAKAGSVGVDIAFVPDDPRDVFPPDAKTWVEVEGLDAVLCGATRENHFRGVCTVVAKLWNLVLPDIGVFGEKDFQQLAILRRMHADLYLCGEIIGMPIVREEDGLAMSSRNARLSGDARAQALAIPRFLEEVGRRFASGERVVERLAGGAAERLSPGVIDYVEFVDARDLSPVQVVGAPTLCAVAVQYGDVRLIDNLMLNP
jgi:pantoate--beta-alanine ligase